MGTHTPLGLTVFTVMAVPARMELVNEGERITDSQVRSAHRRLEAGSRPWWFLSLALGQGVDGTEAGA